MTAEPRQRQQVSGSAIGAQAVTARRQPAREAVFSQIQHGEGEQEAGRWQEGGWGERRRRGWEGQEQVTVGAGQRQGRETRKEGVTAVGNGI